MCLRIRNMCLVLDFIDNIYVDLSTFLQFQRIEE